MQKLTYFEATSDGMLSTLSYGMLSDDMLSSLREKLALVTGVDRLW
jgi:hypothetical protein